MDNYEPIKTIVKPNKYGEPLYLFAESPGQEARMVIELIDRWGMVAAMPDGEDSAGRQKLRLATPDELVTRAMQTTEAAFRAMREAKWIDRSPEVPAVEEVKATG